MSDTPWNDDPEQTEVSEGELLDAVGEGDPGATRYAGDDDHVDADQSDTADERL